MFKKSDPKLTAIGSLFEKYKHTLKAPQGVVVTAFVEVVEDVLNYPLKKELVRYVVSSRTVSLMAPGPVKTEIMLHKKEILQHLKGRLGVENAPKEII